MPEGVIGTVNLAVDNNSDMFYIATTYSQTITLGSFTFSAPPGEFHMLLAKLDSDGNVIWAREAAGVTVQGGKILADKKGNIIMVGYYSQSVQFDGFFLNSLGVGREMFVAKYSSVGDFLWAKSILADDIYPTGVAVDNSNNIYIVGDFVKNILFGSINFNNNVGAHTFLIKYAENGNEQWAKQIQNTQPDPYNPPHFPASDQIAIDDADNIYISGNFQNTVPVIDNLSLPPLSAQNFFLAKFKVDGTVMWLKGENGNSYSRGIVTDRESNIYLAGKNNNSFLKKYDTNGSLAWTKQLTFFM